MKFTCKIENHNSPDYPIVTLRKFYQVIFLEKDFTTLKVYTAVVIGSEAASQRVPLKTNFGIKLNFRCTDYNDIEIAFKANHYDKNKSFTIDKNAWKAVWGNDTEVIDSSGNLKKLYDGLFTASEMPSAPANNGNYLYIKDSKGKDLILNTIAKIISNSDKKDCKEYKVLSNEDLNNKIELVNFTLTEIKLDIKAPYQFNYFIEFNQGDKFEAIDNSIYFILPDGFEASGKEAYLYKKSEAQYTKIDNSFQTLETDPTKYIQEWIDNGIEDRTYYRVYEDKFKSFKENDNYNKLHFNFRVTNSINPLLKQLLYGFLLSLFYSYNLDQTRLLYFKNLYWNSASIPPDFNFIIMFTPLFFTILFKVNLGSIKEKAFSKWARYFSLLLTVLWFIAMYFYNAVTLYSSSENISSPVAFNPNRILIANWLNIVLTIANFISLFSILISHWSVIDIFSFKFPFANKIKLLFSKKK